MPNLTVTRKVDEVDDAATGAKMRELRKKAKVSLRSVASLMGHSAAYVSDLELGRRGWSEERASAFSDAVKSLKA